MDKLFDLDSPVMQALSRIADLMVLNILVVITSLPIITIGAAQTALYYVMGRSLRQEGSLWKDYWRAFASNFKQATLLWLILLGIGFLGLCGVSLYAQEKTTFSTMVLLVVCALSLPWLGTIAWVFPLQSRFENTIWNTLRNALYCATCMLPRTIIMVILNTLPIVLYFGIPPVFGMLSIFFVIVWFALVANINMFLIKKRFLRMEAAIRENAQTPSDQAEET